MPPQTPWAYRVAVRAAVPLLPLAAALNRKLRLGHRGRLQAARHLREWAVARRDPNRPLVWLHAPSVGEGHQAAAVIGELRARRRDWQIAYTYFSPSAVRFAAEVDADVTGFLPYDTAAAAELVLSALRPSALVFVKLDLWPELAVRASLGGVKVGMVAATVRPDSGRLRLPVRRLLWPGYRAVAAAGAVAAADAERLAVLGVPPDHIVVLGDPRYDSVMARRDSLQLDDVAPGLTRKEDRLVAGSSWPDDEEVVLDALVRVRVSHPSATAVIAPHEPTPTNLARVERLAAARQLSVTRLSVPSPTWDVLLVDRVGVLSALYGLGGAAFVGGGFGRAGLHSVLEPAAWGLPVIFGPRWPGHRDAERLVAAGAGFGLPVSRGMASQALAERWSRWLEDQGAREAAGTAARTVVASGGGAAAKSAELVIRMVERATEGQGSGAGSPPALSPAAERGQVELELP